MTSSKLKPQLCMSQSGRSGDEQQEGMGWEERKNRGGARKEEDQGPGKVPPARIAIAKSVQCDWMSTLWRQWVSMMKPCNLQPPTFNRKATDWCVKSFYLDDIISFHKDHPITHTGSPTACQVTPTLRSLPLAWLMFQQLDAFPLVYWTPAILPGGLIQVLPPLWNLELLYFYYISDINSLLVFCMCCCIFSNHCCNKYYTIHLCTHFEWHSSN